MKFYEIHYIVKCSGWGDWIGIQGYMALVTHKVLSEQHCVLDGDFDRNDFQSPVPGWLFASWASVIVIAISLSRRNMLSSSV